MVVPGSTLVKKIAEDKGIDRIFKEARVIAWRRLTDFPEIEALILEQAKKKEAQIQKKYASANILNIYK